MCHVCHMSHMTKANRNERTDDDGNDAEIGLLIARLSEHERNEQRNVEELYTREQVDEKLVKAWFSGWMSRDIAEDEIQQQRLKQEGLVN